MKRGQVTIFVVLGLIVLLGASLFFFINKNVSEDKPGLDVPDVSLESRPAIELVDNCLATVAEKGFRELGSQGGTLKPPKTSYPPYKGEAVLFEPDVIPYWRYLDSCSNPSGCERIFKPGLCIPGNKFCNGLPTSDDSIQKTIQDYIDSNIESCVNKFSSIGQQYDISIDGVPKSEVIFKEGSTVVLLDYPITITSMSTDNILRVNTFKVDLDLDFYNIYKLADEILHFEKESNYFERETMNLVNVYAGLDNPVLPPTDVIEPFNNNGAGPWVQSEVRDTLENDLLPMISLVHFANVKNNYPIIFPEENNYSSYANGFYHSLLPKTSDTIYSNLDVDVNYLFQPIYSKVGDGSAVLKGTSMINLKPSFLKHFLNIFLKDFRFPYDISYPLVISISDSEAFKGRGYDFQFGLEVNVRNNMPAYHNFTYVDLSTNKQVDSEVLKLPQEISVETFDKLTGEPLSDVSISYICGPEFGIGLTKQVGDSAILKAKFPYCEFGGFIRYRKDGYLGSSISFNNVEGLSNQSFKVDLWPLKKREVIVRKRTLDDIDRIEAEGSAAMWLYDSAYSNLSSHDVVLLNLERKFDSSYEDTVPLIGFLRYTSSNYSSSENYDSLKSALDEGLASGLYSQEEYDNLLDDLNKTRENTDETSLFDSRSYYFDLAPGDYVLDATLMDSSGLYLPNETVTVDENATWFEKLLFPNSSTFDFPEENFSTWVTGGSNINFTISPAQVYQEDKPIIFYVIEQRKANDWTDFLSLEDWSVLAKKYAILLFPKVS